MTITWNKIHWGAFTRQYHDFKRRHGGPPSLEDFAYLVIHNQHNFRTITIKRAYFYLNVLKVDH